MGTSRRVIPEPAMDTQVSALWCLDNRCSTNIRKVDPITRAGLKLLTAFRAAQNPLALSAPEK